MHARNWDYFTSRNRNMNGRLHSDAKLNLVMWRPITLLLHEPSANHWFTSFSLLFLFFRLSSGNFLAKGFKILPVASLLKNTRYSGQVFILKRLRLNIYLCWRSSCVKGIYIIHGRLNCSKWWCDTALPWSVTQEYLAYPGGSAFLREKLLEPVIMYFGKWRDPWNVQVNWAKMAIIH